MSRRDNREKRGLIRPSSIQTGCLVFREGKKSFGLLLETKDESVTVSGLMLRLRLYQKEIEDLYAKEGLVIGLF